MPREKRDTVEYFPHYAKPGGGKTKRLLFKEFGHAGKSCWFELLEILADSDGHYLDLREDIDWLDVVETLQIDEETAKRFFDFLVRLGKIDAELWEKKVVWCQNLVNEVEHVYRNRRRKAPKKPVIDDSNSQIIQETEPSDDSGDVSTVETPVFSPEMQQSKVEQRRAKQSREEQSRAKQTRESSVGTSAGAVSRNGNSPPGNGLLRLPPDGDIFATLLFVLRKDNGSRHPGAKANAEKKVAELRKTQDPAWVSEKLEHYSYCKKFRPELLGDKPTGYLIASIEKRYPPPFGYDEHVRQQVQESLKRASPG